MDIKKYCIVIVGDFRLNCIGLNEINEILNTYKVSQVSFF